MIKKLIELLNKISSVFKWDNLFAFLLNEIIGRTYRKYYKQKTFYMPSLTYNMCLITLIYKVY